MRNILRRRELTLLAWAAMLTIALGVPAAEAVPLGKNKNKNKGNGQSQAAASQQFAGVLHTLQSIKLTLERADHDYGGHRAAAVRDIGQAERQLREAMHHGQKQTANRSVSQVPRNGGGKGAAHSEPQVLSNAQLAATIPMLNNTMAALGSANHDFGGHRQKAIVDLKAAIVQLETALKFSQVKNQNK